MTRTTRPGPARLNRLRLVLTGLFTVMNTVGLIVLAPLVIGLDDSRGREQLDNDLRRVTSSVLRLIREDGAAVELARLNADAELSDGCPQFAVLGGGAGRFEHHSRRNCVTLDGRTQDELARQAVQSGQRLVAWSSSPSGQQVRVGVEPFRNGEGQLAGAVLAWADATETERDHRTVVLVVLAGCIGLILVAAAAGYFVSGRAIRPAAAALQQQEVLLAETAHDLRTPVAALRALAETAAQDPNQRADLLPRTVRLAGRMGDIIDGLLVRARLAAGVEQLSMQPVWLDQLVTGIVEDTPPAGATVSVITAPSKVYADPALVQRAVGNLLDNALRYGREPDRAAVVTVTVAAGRVTVTDNGPGVDQGLSEELFDRFTGSGGSSGLGLSIVRWVALAHGGTLTVHNADEGGAIFEFMLPEYEG